MAFHIREATLDDLPAIDGIFRAHLVVGETHAWDAGISSEVMRSIWFEPGRATFVLIEGSQISAAYCIKPNQPFRGSHVANGNYVVAQNKCGRGLGTYIALDSLDRARSFGYVAIQFNAVVATNIAAIRLWQKCGFQTVGRIPGGFAHPRFGLVDLLIMYRSLPTL
ncbi:MAG: GNAT family N-acetyltransferase [Candidatus Eremiobacteraeota bacterium]|nr:GNAT family N-acetyltransferase [Candidatus Eremiobacteraeota bacterium]